MALLKSPCSFEPRAKQIKVSPIERNSDHHMFEKLVRNLMMACSIPKEGENSPEIQKKAKKFMKFLTRHITLILIVKNGTLS